MNFSFVPLFLVTLILLGVVSNNNSITISATILLLMQQTALIQFVPLVEKHGLNLGIILLTIGVLSPLVSGKAQAPPVAEFLNFKMISAVFIGIFVAWLAGRGVPYDGTAACFNYRAVNRDGYRGGIYGRYPCRAADCGRHLVFCRRKGLKSPFHFGSP